jgi:predicted Zn-dependent protease
MTSPSGTKSLVAGTIALSGDYYASLTERGDQSEALAVLLHEFGHVFGLAHVDSSGELMNADNNDVSSFGPGDRKGLRRLGQGPCT